MHSIQQAVKPVLPQSGYLTQHKRQGKIIQKPQAKAPKQKKEANSTSKKPQVKAWLSTLNMKDETNSSF